MRTNDTPVVPRAAVLFFLLVVPVGAAAETRDYLQYFIEQIDFVNPSHELRFGAALSHTNRDEYEQADQVLQALLADDNDWKKALTHAQVTADLGMVKAVQGDSDSALSLLNQSIGILERTAGPFDIHLFKPLMARSLVRQDRNLYEDSEDDLRRAQHLIHRQKGVYSLDQLPVIDQLTVVKLRNGELVEADQQQDFNLKINEENYGDNSEKLVPVLQKIGAYFASRADMIPLISSGQYGETSTIPLGDQSLSMGSYASGMHSTQLVPAGHGDIRQYRQDLFRKSMSLYERAIGIIESKYGEDDIRLVEPLRGLANARILRGATSSSAGGAEDNLERVVRLVRNDPDTDLPDLVRALVDLGDLYEITSDGRADETYLEAWNLLDKPEYGDLRNTLFGTPTRVLPARRKTIVIDRYPSGAEEGEPLYVDAVYTVRTNGTVSNVDIVDGNVSNEDKRMVRHYLSNMRYRPRLVDGKPVETEGLMTHQSFDVIEPEPVTEVSVDVR